MGKMQAKMPPWAEAFDNPTLCHPRKKNPSNLTSWIVKYTSSLKSSSKSRVSNQVALLLSSVSLSDPTSCELSKIKKISLTGEKLKRTKAIRSQMANDHGIWNPMKCRRHQSQQFIFWDITRCAKNSCRLIIEDNEAYNDHFQGR